jgi:DNA repair protein RecN (Recombination protein N)
VLSELRLENYAVIDNVAVEFAPGLNLLAAVFEVEGSAEQQVSQILETNGIDAEDGSIILRREIAAGGKGRVFVNNQPATVAVLRQLAPYFAIVHAQNETLRTFDGPARLALLDTFAGTHLELVVSAYRSWTHIRQRIADLESDEQDRLRLLDLGRFQQREIADAKLQPGEDEQLETEKRVLANAEKIHNAAMNAFDLLYEGEASTSATLRAAQRNVEELARYEPKFHEAMQALETARISVEDVGATLRDYAGGIQASPEHLADVEDRLALIDRLKRKYAPTLEEVIQFGEEVARKLSETENKDEILRQLRGELAAAGDAYMLAAREVSKKRYEAARKLERRVEAEVNDLAMKSKFRIEVSGTDEEANWKESGFDEVVYLIATNPGEPRRPLEEIASGGEMSRVILALKTAVESTQGARKRSPAAQRTLVFDEIDTGIGGRAAEAVGKKLKELSRANQVLCVTHLPQIATFADHHYVIEKKETGGRSRTSVRPIAGEERTEEVARMLSGAKLTESSLKHAEQMLKANA